MRSPTGRRSVNLPGGSSTRRPTNGVGNTCENPRRNCRELGQATGRLREAEALITERQTRLARVAARVGNSPRRPKVFCMEWADPVYCAGHWVPEMVEMAGGIDELARKGADSVRTSWDD